MAGGGCRDPNDYSFPEPGSHPGCRVRRQVYRGMISAARGIVAQHGPKGLYNGLGITLIEIMPYAALQFGLYDSFNTAYDVARVRAPPRVLGFRGLEP